MVNKAQLADFILELGLVGSKSELRRLSQQGGIYFNNRPVDLFDESVMALDDTGQNELRLGKRRYIKIEPDG